MIKTLTQYQTEDGKLFQSLAEATIHHDYLKVIAEATTTKQKRLEELDEQAARHFYGWR